MANSFLFLFLLVSMRGSQINYVQNGGFEDPRVLGSYQQKTNIPNWMGYFDLVATGLGRGLNDSQIIDLSAQWNGFIQQNVTLPLNGVYLLSFLSKDRAKSPTIYRESVAEVYWNQKLVAVCSPQPGAIKQMDIEIMAKSGSNILKFVEVGINNGIGLLMDNITLYFIRQEQPPAIESQMPRPLPFKIIELISALVPFNQLKMSHFCFLIEDIWLYIYAKRSYSTNINNIFKTIDAIESAKWNFFVGALKLNATNLALPIQNYTLHSNPKHLEIDGKDDFMFKNIYLFLIFTIPQIIATILVGKLVFHCLQSYKVSIFFRRFSFFPCVLLQSAFEGNISYFTYLSFNQFKILFSYTACDKLFLGFAVVFFWGCLAYVTCFYFMISHFYQKRAGYFIYCYYRDLPGLSFISIKFGVRSILRGIIFSLFYQHYFFQCWLLIAEECMIIALAIYLQAKHEIFIYESKLCIQICHHSLLVAITFAFLIEKTLIDDAISALCDNVQVICIYSMAAVSIADFVAELFSQKRVYSQQFLALTEVAEKSRFYNKILTAISNDPNI